MYGLQERMRNRRRISAGGLFTIHRDVWGIRQPCFKSYVAIDCQVYRWDEGCA